VVALAGLRVDGWRITWISRCLPGKIGGRHLPGAWPPVVPDPVVLTWVQTPILATCRARGAVSCGTLRPACRPLRLSSARSFGGGAGGGVARARRAVWHVGSLGSSTAAACAGLDLRFVGVSGGRAGWRTPEVDARAAQAGAAYRSRRRRRLLPGRGLSRPRRRGREKTAAIRPTRSA